MSQNPYHMRLLTQYQLHAQTHDLCLPRTAQPALQAIIEPTTLAFLSIFPSTLQ